MFGHFFQRLNVRLLFISTCFILIAGFQLFVPTEQIGNRSCGKFKTCPNGTVCMRLYNRQSPFSCFMPHFSDSSAFLPPPETNSSSKNITSDIVKMVELPGCKCPPQESDMEANCWSNNLLSILFLLVVLALIICVPIFTIMRRPRH